MSTQVRRALYGRMAGDTTLSNMLAPAVSNYNKAIYHQVAPSTAQYPFVIFQKSSGVAVMTFTDPEAMNREMWLVKAVDANTSADTAETIAARLVTLLNDAPLSISGQVLLFLRKESDVDYAETENGVTYHHVGGLFRLTTD